MNTMTYRGYAARIEYSDEDQCLIGHVAGINDVVGFHGESVAELCKLLAWPGPGADLTDAGFVDVDQDDAAFANV